MRAVNNHLVMEHYSNIANTMKYYFIGIDIFHDRLLTPFQFVEQIAQSNYEILDSDLYVMTAEARKKYVLDIEQVKQLLEGTLKFAGNLFFNENNILLCVKFADNPVAIKCNEAHPYSEEDYVHSKFFTSIGQLMKHVKELPLQTVKEMHIVPVEAACVRLDKLYSDYFIRFLESYRKKLLSIKVTATHKI